PHAHDRPRDGIAVVPVADHDRGGLGGVRRRQEQGEPDHGSALTPTRAPNTSDRVQRPSRSQSRSKGPSTGAAQGSASLPQPASPATSVTSTSPSTGTSAGRKRPPTQAPGPGSPTGRSRAVQAGASPSARPTTVTHPASSGSRRTISSSSTRIVAATQSAVTA